MIWTDRGNAAETIVTQLGASKVGVTIVSFDEATSEEALDHALGSTNARGLVYTHGRTISEGAPTRTSLISNLMPELDSMYRGEELNIAKYPHLKLITQTGFRELRGINRFKDVPVYANAAMTSYSIPENSPDDLFRIVLRGGKQISTYTN